ncbi:MAG: carbon-nitrogen family hydrolase [Spirochaetia bacterium]|nr:carbon-nitrogen family hydrolase [Spirochaetia bacterium]
MLIALCSLNVEWQDVKRNKILVREAVQTSSSKGANLVVFPEMCLTGFGKESVEHVKDSDALSFFSLLAKEFQIALVFGWVRGENSSYFNSATIVDNNGVEKLTYDKIHLFRHDGEDEYITGGKEVPHTILDGIRVGLTICYDLRFSEIYRYLGEFVELIIAIASWPQSREEHFLTLLKARAIENQLFIVGLNRSGRDNKGLTYGGNAVVFTPCGKEVEKKNIGTHLDLFDIDINKVKEERENYKFLKDKRKELYHTWSY